MSRNQHHESEIKNMNQEAVKFRLYVQKHRKAKGIPLHKIFSNWLNVWICHWMNMYSAININKTISIQEINEVLDNLSLDVRKPKKFFQKNVTFTKIFSLYR